MKKTYITAVSAISLGTLFLTSCETPTGQGAAIGAGSGAVIGALASGGAHGSNRAARGAIAGAAIGTAAGALIGASIEADERGYYDGYEEDYYPYGRRTGRRGLLRSPYPPYAIVDVRGVPRGALVRDPASGRAFRRP